MLRRRYREGSRGAVQPRDPEISEAIGPEMTLGALFSGQANMDLEDAPGEADGSAYPEDELRMAYEEAVRRAAKWYRSRLFGPNAEPDQEGGAAPDAPAMSEPDDTDARSRRSPGGP